MEYELWSTSQFLSCMLYCFAFYQDNTTVSLDANVPLADLIRAEDDTLHSTTDRSLPSDTYQLFAVIVKTEGDRFYACIKTEGQASHKW